MACWTLLARCSLLNDSAWRTNGIRNACACYHQQLARAPARFRHYKITRAVAKQPSRWQQTIKLVVKRYIFI